MWWTPTVPSRYLNNFKVDDNSEISEPVEIANIFCNYFSNIARNLAKKIHFQIQFFLKLLLKLKSQKLLNVIVQGIWLWYNSHIDNTTIDKCYLWTHIVNLSITHGIVPDEMTITRVIPLFKAWWPIMTTEAWSLIIGQFQSFQASQNF